MDPVYWFQDITTTQMDKAVISMNGGQPTILINNSTNPVLHAAIKGRVHDNVTQVIFD